MADTTNPRDALDAALEAVRRGYDLGEPTERITMEATVVCAEALSLLVDAHLPAAPEPAPAEPDPRESLSDETPVGHGWVMGANGERLFKPAGGRFTWWLSGGRRWASQSGWYLTGLVNPRPATVGDLRRVELPVTKWPDITAPEPDPEEPSLGSVILDRDGDEWFRTVDGWRTALSGRSREWTELHRKCGPVTVIHRAAS